MPLAAGTYTVTEHATGPGCNGSQGDDPLILSFKVAPAIVPTPTPGPVLTASPVPTAPPVAVVPAIVSVRADRAAPYGNQPLDVVVTGNVNNAANQKQSCGYDIEIVRESDGKTMADEYWPTFATHSEGGTSLAPGVYELLAIPDAGSSPFLRLPACLGKASAVITIYPPNQ